MRTRYTVAMIAAAAGLPYAASETDLGRSAMQSLGSAKTTVQSSIVSPGGDDSLAHREVERILEKNVDRYRYATLPQATVGGNADASGRETDIAASPTVAGRPAGYSLHAQGSLVGGPIRDLREVLRFDITPEWVTQRFSRVTTVLAETNLEGLRVPLVTGTGPADVAGSISYYFDHSGRLQRVMLHGFTGDSAGIVETMTKHYGLQAEPTLDAGVYTRRWNGRPVHFLRLTRAPIVYSDALHHKFTVYLELNQPDLRYGISSEARKIIGSDRGTGRW